MKQKLLLKTMLLLGLMLGGSICMNSAFAQVSSVAPQNGKSYVVAAYVNNKYYALPNTTTNGGTLSGTEVALNSLNKVSTTNASGKTWTLEEGTDNNVGKYIIKYTSGNDTYYLYKNGTGASNYNFAVNKTSKNYWSFTANGTGYTVTAIGRGDNNTNIQCNGGTFRCYSSATAIILLEIGDVPSYTIAAQSNNTEFGTVSLSGTTITATPQSGYRVSTTNPYTVYPEGSATVTQSNNTFTVTPSANTTVTINFEAIPTHTVTFSVNGTTSTQSYTEGAAITFPTNPSNIDDKVFVGWVTTAIAGTTDEEPDFVDMSTASMQNSNITYYAVFAEAGVGSPTLTKMTSSDTFTANDKVVIVATYGENVYAMYQATTNTSYVNKYIFDNNVETVAADNKNWLTVSAGSTTGTWKLGDATNGYVYNSSSNDLKIDTSNSTEFTLSWNSTQEKFTLVGNSRWLSYRSDLSNKYFRMGGASTGTPSGVAYFDIYKYNTGGVSYSGYCTTVAPDTRTAVNMTGFSATSTTIVRGNITNTTVTNDQSDWTPVYTYESDNTDVATVDENGVITAVAKGTANITATLNIAQNDENYKAGDTKSMSIEITVVNPSHNVAFYDNNTHLTSSDASVEEGEAIIFPDAPSVGGYDFIGWATAEINGTATEAPSTVTSATMGTADVTYYAVYGNVEKTNVTATFDASDISNLTSTDTNTWTDNTTGIELFINNGQLYEGNNTNPAAWNVTKSTSSNDYYLSIGRTNCAIKKVEVTVTGSDYAFGDYYAYTSISDESGTDLTADVTNEGNVYTWILNGNYEQVLLWSGYDYQVRAKKIEVDAILEDITAYMTTLPTYTVTISSFGWASYIAEKNVYFNSNVSAYIATGNSGNSVTLTEVAAVEKGTPVVVKAKNAIESSQTFTLETVDADDCDDVSANLLEVCDGSAAAEGYNYFVLAKDDTSACFKQWTGVLSSLNGRVVLPLQLDLTTQGGARALNIVFSGEATGIDTIEHSTMTIDSYYNLSGQRVEIPKKGGLYIVNGKKVVIK